MVTESVSSVSTSLPIVSHYIAAVGALGTAAYGLVDISKAIMGGVSNAGFSFIRRAVTPLIGPDGQSKSESAELGVSAADILATLRANWLNGIPKADQKASAKSLIRLTITPDNVARLAQRTGVDPTTLGDAATRIKTGSPLLSEHISVLGRLDAIVSAVLDQGYERADQQYRNTSKFAAALVAIGLAILAGGINSNVSTMQQVAEYLSSRDFLLAFLVGAIATPLAPIAKDLSSSLAAAVSALSAGKR